MEDLYISLFSEGKKTYFLLSYFHADRHLYKYLGQQLRKRNNLKSDITMLITAHTENIYFNPIYYKTFIAQYEEALHKLMIQTQFDDVKIEENGQVELNSLTPSNYLDNQYNINIFGY